jgi:hypothetical protein
MSPLQWSSMQRIVLSRDMTAHLLTGQTAWSQRRVPLREASIAALEVVGRLILSAAYTIFKLRTRLRGSTGLSTLAAQGGEAHP